MVLLYFNTLDATNLSAATDGALRLLENGVEQVSSKCYETFSEIFQAFIFAIHAFLDDTCVESLDSRCTLLTTNTIRHNSVLFELLFAFHVIYL